MMKIKAIHPIKILLTIVVFAAIINLAGVGVGKVKNKVGEFKFSNIKIEQFVGR